jgi:hypothetical protein
MNLYAENKTRLEKFISQTRFSAWFLAPVGELSSEEKMKRF